MPSVKEVIIEIYAGQKKTEARLHATSRAPVEEEIEKMLDYLFGKEDNGKEDDQF